MAIPDGEFRLHLHLLDRQLRGPDGRLLAKVDDLELGPDEDGDELRVTAILTGALALGQRVGGRPGRWTTALVRRLSGRPDPQPHRIDPDEVTEIASAVTLRSDDCARGIAPLEDWVRTRIIDRIPGSRHAGQ